MAVEKDTDTTIGIITDEELRKVLNIYGYEEEDWIVFPLISINEEVIELTRKTETSRQLLILIREELYVLKEIPWYCSEEKFTDYETNLQNFLKDYLPVPKIMKTLKQKLYANLGNKYFILQRYYESDNWNREVDKTYNAGKILGRLHKQSRKFYHKDAPQKNLFESSKEMLDLSFKIFSKMEKYEKNNRFLEYYNRTNKLLNTMEYEAYQKNYQKLKICIHGDYNPYNLLYNKEKVIGIIDFDNSCIDNPIHDISEGLVHFSYINYKPFTTYYHSPPMEFNSNLFSSFLKGYLDEYPDTLKEVFKYLPETIATITYELSALGFVCGDYSAKQMRYLLESNQKVYQKAYELTNQFQKDYMSNKKVFDFVAYTLIDKDKILLE